MSAPVCMPTDDDFDADFAKIVAYYDDPAGDTGDGGVLPPRRQRSKQARADDKLAISYGMGHRRHRNHEREV